MGTATRAMAVGKNKRLTKGKKGSKKKAIDPFTKKDWYDVKAPALFTNTNVGKTLVTRTAGTKIASDGLKGRVFEVSLGDLNKSEDDSFRKIRLRVEDVQGTQCLTNFWGMSFTTDKLRSRLTVTSRPPTTTCCACSALASPSVASSRSARLHTHSLPRSVPSARRWSTS